MPCAVAQVGAWVAAIGLVCGLIAEVGDRQTLYAVALLTRGASWVGLAVTKVLQEEQPGLALGAGVLANTLVVPEALPDWTNGSVSSAGTLLMAGLTLLAASAIGLRLRREVG